MSINEERFANFDMNLIVVFMLLYQERNVSRTAKLLRVGQPAVSASLVRLRRQFEDPLFTRCRWGIVPTDRAEEIVAELMPAISKIESVLCPKG
ncbi:LysR family transcriptional regulator [Pseudomonas sp. UBA1879]|uniref:LysR family transcriptional regulator n=1 Tax=Pseudomonas sp. UBA1879 TaxID=1947305 RepID=UPI0025E96142|nr:LysR family transcriptional regulator [Pseudomonas sp. UBA1879]